MHSTPFSSSDSARIPARHQLSKSSLAGSASPLADTTAAHSQDEAVPGQVLAASVTAGFGTGSKPEQHDPGRAPSARQSIAARVASPFASRTASPFASQSRMVSPFASEVSTPFPDSLRPLATGLPPASSGPAALAGDQPQPIPQQPRPAPQLLHLEQPAVHHPGSIPQLAPLQQPPRSLRSTASATGVTLESRVTVNLRGDSAPLETQQEQPPGEERQHSQESATAGSRRLSSTSSGKARSASMASTDSKAMSKRASFSEDERMATLHALGLPRAPSGGRTAFSGPAA